MPRKPKRVLLGLEVTKAIRTRKCSADKTHRIGPGESLLEVVLPGPAAGNKPYCVSCADRMLTSAREEIEKVDRDLRNS